jgi:hypothetical protein
VTAETCVDTTPLPPALADPQARLAVYDRLRPVILRGLNVGRSEALYDCDRDDYQAALADLGDNDTKETAS